MRRLGRSSLAWGVSLALLGFAALRPSRALPDESGTWSTMSVSGTPPSPRRDFSVAYTGESMIVFGGYDLHALNDTYRLVLGPPAAWLKFPSVSGTPVPRSGHRAIFDPPRDRQVIFGGYGTTIYLRDPWEFRVATNDWNFLSYGALVPSPRSYYGMVHDPIRRRALLISGYTGSEALQDVWLLALTGSPNWTPLSPAGPAPEARLAHTVIYQPGRDRVILFGGVGSTILNDVWALTLSGTPTWQQLTPSGPLPAARFAHVAVYDALRDRMVIFGGYDGVNSRNDAWALSLGSAPAWSRLTPSGPLPEARSSSGGVYDAIADRLVVFGGFDATAQRFLNDTWSLMWSISTAARASLVSAHAEPGIARITWQIAGGSRSRVTVQRREKRSGWQSVGERFVDGEGRVGFEDRQVEAGARYGYRLGLVDGGRESFFGEVWLEVPRVASLSLAGTRPNPATNELVIAFSLGSASPATIELVDIAGRRVLERDVGTMGPGEHVLRLEEARSLPAGLYLARLRQQGLERSRKVLIAR